MPVDAAGEYTSSTTLATLATWLAGCRRIVVLTHLKPDGDAIGSTISVVRALNAASPFGPAPRAEAWYFGPLPPWFADVVGDTPHRALDAQGPPDHLDCDAVLIVDTGSRSQLEPAQDWLRKRAEVCAIVDHHVQGDADLAALRVIDTRAAAACQPATTLCCLLLGVPGPAALPEPVATPLYLGLATDTGWFRHSNVDKAVMTLAGDLIDARARHLWLYQTVEQQETPSRLRLLARALASIELAEAGRVAVMSLRVRDFAECQSQPGESGGVVDFTQAIPSVQVTVLLTEAEAREFGRDGGVITKISMRSKPTGLGVDVNAVARELGGGGHVRAAGARLPLPLDATKAKVLEAIRRRLETP